MRKGSKLTITILMITAIISGCGKLRTHEDKIVNVQGGGASLSSAGSQDSSDPMVQIQQFVELYLHGGSITKDQLANVFTKYKDRLTTFLSGSGMTSQDVVDLLFQLDSNHDGKLTVAEAAEGIQSRIPILRWFNSNDESIMSGELSDRVAKEYPTASATAREGLVDILLQYDAIWAGGNGDGKVTRPELASAGLILGMLGQTDFTQGPLSAHPDSASAASGDDAIVVAELKSRLNEQLLGRYTSGQDFTTLSNDDLQLEWMQLALRFYLCDKLTHSMGGSNDMTGKIAAADQAKAVAAITGLDAKGFSSVFLRFYGNPAAGGDGDGSLNTIEMFELSSDLQFARGLSNLAGGSFSAAGLATNVNRPKILSGLKLAFPLTGGNMFTAGDAARDSYFDSLKNFDSKNNGGNENGTLDLPELALAMGYAHVTENVFALYDSNHDGMLSRDEANPLFALLGITDGRMGDAFFADVGLSGGSKFSSGIKLFFSGGAKHAPLEPYAFYTRMMKVAPQLMGTTK